jgi:cell division protein FtsQ
MDRAMIGEALLGRLQRRPRAAPRRRVRRRPRVKLMLAVVTVLGLLGGGWLWLRDSSLVAVRRVSIVGVQGADAAQIRAALLAAAQNMTTLDVRIGQLKTAVAPYPVVKDLRVTTHFPHGMRIRVIEQTTVGAIAVAGRKIAVTGDGTLLPDVTPSPSLPTIPMRVPPGGRRLTDPDALGAVTLLAAAAPGLVGRISQITTVSGHGLVAQVRNGPSIYFGNAAAASAKWTAAVAVLGDAGSAGALYIDVTDPERPAAGAGSAAVADAGSAAAADAGSAAAANASSTSSTSASAATGSGGSAGSAGATGSGGSAGSAGATGSGGSAGSAGATGSGGSAGSAGATGSVGSTAALTSVGGG